MNFLCKYYHASLLILFLTVSSIKSESQVTANLEKDIPGAEAFKSWLSHSWLKSFIDYNSLENEFGKTYLTLNFNCTDDCTKKWESLKNSFDSLSTITFEEYLWKKANFHLELPQDKFILEIYNSVKPFETPCFYRGIYYNDTLIIKWTNCKDLGGQSTLKYDKFNPSFMMKKLTLKEIDKSTDQILDFLYKKCEIYFKAKGLNVEFVKYKSDSNSIEFQVNNLKNEVIKRSLISGTIEKLQFKITCSFHSANVKFVTIVNGKYGSNYFKPYSDKGYNDMEDDYKSEFQNYVNDFTNNKMISWLK